ncbi:MAG: hypothetical protein HY904_24855 [Deltaproteobacteria bacterium]|nr:hypothetical protein [Deltaproteobacteria bacterium]
MKQTLIALAELQAVDTRIKGIESARETVFAKQKALMADVDKLRGEFKQVSMKMEEAEKEKRAKELELQGERDKQKKWEGRLDELRNTREFAALGREVEMLKRNISDLGDAVAQKQLDLEELSKGMKDVEARLSSAEKAHKEEVEVAKAAVGDRDAVLAKEKEARQRLAQKLPANALKKYEQLLGKRHGLGVVQAVAGSCKGCNMHLPAQQFIRVQKGDTIEECPACKRILYFETLLDRGTAHQGA